MGYSARPRQPHCECRWIEIEICDNDVALQSLMYRSVSSRDEIDHLLHGRGVHGEKSSALRLIVPAHQ
jgi:hypothetical protein